MAGDTTTQRFTIDTSPAVSGLRTLRLEIATYNKVVAQSATTQDKLSDSTLDLLKHLTEEKEKIRQTTAAWVAEERALLKLRQQYDPLYQVTRKSVDTKNQETTAISRNRSAMEQQIKTIIEAASKMSVKNRALSEQKKKLDADTQSAKNNATANQNLSTTARDLLYILHSFAKVTLFTAIHRGVLNLTHAMTDSIKKAATLDRRIAEIRTITQNANLATNEWSKELVLLSNTFGIDVLEVAEGTYQAISNQIVGAKNATSFMREEMKLAITTVSSLDQAVNATSSVINAYKLNSADAAAVNAVLFEGVNLGRFRLEELGSGFGRVNVIANQLGITFKEATTAITVLTTKGIDADTSMTLLQNVMLKLIKPTKGMQAAFDEMGVTSGKAAIETFGFFGVLRKLADIAQRTGDETSELGTIFEDMRAIVGAQGLVQSFDQLEAVFGRLSSAQDSYTKATKIALETQGNVALQEVEKLKNMLLVKFGQPLLTILLDTGKAVGGFTILLERLLDVARIGTTVWLAYRVAQGSVIIGTAAASAAQVIFGRTLKANIAALRAYIAASTSAKVATAGWTLGLTLIISALVEMAFQSSQTSSEIESLGDTAKAASEKLTAENFEAFNAGLTRTFDALQERLQSSTRGFFAWLADIQKVNTALIADFDEAFKNIGKVIEKSTTRSLDKIKKELAEAGRAADKLRDRAEKARGEAFDLRFKAADKDFDVSLEGLSDEEKLTALEEERTRIHKAGLEARLRGEDEAAEKSFDRAVKLAERESELLEKIEKDALEKRERLVTTRKSVRFRFSGGKFRTSIHEGDPVSRKIDAPDEAAATAAAERRLAVESSIAEMARERIAAELKFAEEAEARAAAEEERIKEREEAIAVFRDKLAAVDAFSEKKGDPREFAGLVKEAEAAAEAAGLTEREKLEFLRAAKKEEILIERKAAAEIAQAKIDASRKAVEEAKRQQEEFLKKQKETAATSVTAVGGFIDSAQGLVGAAKGALSQSSVLRQDNRQKFENEEAIKKEVEALEALLNLATKKNKAGEVDLILVEKIEEKYKSIVALIGKAESSFSASHGGTLFGDTGIVLPGTRTDEFGNVVKDARLGNVFGEQLRALEKVKEAVNAFKAADAAFKNSNEVIKETERVAASLPEKFRELGVSGFDGASVAATGHEALNMVLTREIENLREIEAIQARLRADADALGVGEDAKGFAFGGVARGTDRIPAMLSDGETVMTRMASRNWGPLLNAMNRSVSNSVSFGDIHINTTKGTTSGQAQEIAAELVRLNRRGLFTLRR